MLASPSSSKDTVILLFPLAVMVMVFPVLIMQTMSLTNIVMSDSFARPINSPSTISIWGFSMQCSSGFWAASIASSRCCWGARAGIES